MKITPFIQLAFLLLAFCGLIPLAGSQEPPPEAATILAQHKEQLAAFEKTALDRLKGMNAKYLERLNAMEKQFAAAGDLDAIVVVREEKAGLSSDKPPSTPVPQTPPALKSLRLAFDIGIVRYKTWAKEERNKLVRETEKALGDLQTSLTKANKIEAALGVQNALSRFQGTHVIEDTQAPKANALPPTLQAAGQAGATSEGLILYLPFDTAVPEDRSGNQVPVQNRGAQFIPDGVSGGAFAFDGKESYIIIAPPKELKVINDATIAVWINIKPVRNVNTAGRQYIFSSIGSTPTATSKFITPGLGLHIDTSPRTKLVAFNTYKPETPSGRYICGTTRGFQHGDWVHCISIRRAGNIELYLDGKKTSSARIDGSHDARPIDMTQSPWYIGDYNGNNPHYAEGKTSYNINGFIDEFMLFNRALTDAEIQWFADQARSIKRR